MTCFCKRVDLGLGDFFVEFDLDCSFHAETMTFEGFTGDKRADWLCSGVCLWFMVNVYDRMILGFVDVGGRGGLL